jgi:hypothetical protein
MHKSKFSLKGWVAASAVIGAAFVFGGAAQAAQTVDFAEAGSTTAITSKSVTPGGAFSFDVVYKGGANESGLGLKLRYNPAQFSAINVVSGQTFMSCNIGGAVGTVGDSTDGIQKQTGSFSGFGGQFVAGWIYTANDAGAVKWPNGPAPTAANDCLVNSGSATNSGSDVRLFRVNATPVAGFTGSTTMELTADGNFSYAQASPGVTNKTLTLNAGSGGGLALLTTGDAIVSRKVHGAFTCEVPVSAAGVITGTGAASNATVESRQATVAAPHRVVFKFNQNVTSVQGGNVAVAVASGVAPTATTTFSGSEMIVDLSGVTNGQRVSITGNNINGAGVNASIVLGFLVGDVNNSRSVNSTDAAAVRGQNLVALSASNCKFDVNVSGAINSTDAAATRGQNLQTLQ